MGIKEPRAKMARSRHPTRPTTSQDNHLSAPSLLLLKLPQASNDRRNGRRRDGKNNPLSLDQATEASDEGEGNLKAQTRRIQTRIPPGGATGASAWGMDVTSSSGANRPQRFKPGPWWPAMKLALDKCAPPWDTLWWGEGTRTGTHRATPHGQTSQPRPL